MEHSKHRSAFVVVVVVDFIFSVDLLLLLPFVANRSHPFYTGSKIDVF